MGWSRKSQGGGYIGAGRKAGTFETSCGQRTAALRAPGRADTCAIQRSGRGVCPGDEASSRTVNP